MKIVFLDAKTLGDDIDYSQFERLGKVVRYPFTSPEEVPDRAREADILVVNKVPVNEATISTAGSLKLVCVTATGTNNLDKDYLAKRGSSGAMLPDILQNVWPSTPLPCCSIFWSTSGIMTIIQETAGISMTGSSPTSQGHSTNLKA